jgi:hypothetical protein
MVEEPAFEHLIDCLGWGDSDPNLARLGELSDAGWQRVIQLSARHHVSDYLYHQLKTGAKHTPPNWVVQNLREKYHQGVVQMDRYYSEFSKVLKMLTDSGTQPIALKGAHLADVVYEHHSLRPMTDIDLLVKVEDLQPASEVLLSLGYKSLRPYDLKVEIESHHHLPPFIKKDTLPVEIHWSLVNPNSPFDIDIADLWARARLENIAGVNVLVLSLEDLLISICIHAAYSHNFSFGISPFIDIAKVVQHYRSAIDWQAIVERAIEWRATKPVFLGLYLTQDLLKISIPDDALAALSPNDFELKTANWAKRAILGGDVSPILSSEISNLGEAKSVYEIAAIIFRRIFVPQKELDVMYPSLGRFPRLIIGYPKRFWDLCIRYGRISLLILKKDRNVIQRARCETALRKWLES